MNSGVGSRRGSTSGDHWETIVVCRLGSDTSFSHQAALAYFGEQVTYRAAETIGEVFRSVEREDACFGMVPLENSCEGSVITTLDLLSDHDVKICGELFLEVRLFFLSRADGPGDVKRLFSHPMAYEQCRLWISGKFPGTRVISTGSTSEAAFKAAKDPFSGCVGSRTAGYVHGLRVFGRDIQDFSGTMTRFVVIAKSECPLYSGPGKTSLMVMLQHMPGALMRVLAPVARQGINILRIEPRPLKNRKWEYRFFMDLDGDMERPDVEKAVYEMEKQAVFIKKLGTYPKGKAHC